MSIRFLSSSVVALAVCSLSAHSFGDIVVAWGGDSGGELGDGVAGPNRATAAPVINLGPLPAGGKGPGGQSLFAAGSGNAVAVRGGALLRWGTVRVDEETYAADPVPDVATGLESGVTLVAASNDYFDSYVVKEGTLYRYFPEFAPQLVTATAGELSGGITAVESGPAVLIIREGALWSLGSNQFGMLGDGSTVSGRNTAALVPGFENGVTDIAVGDWECAAVKNGAVYTWGRNFGGSLGIGLVDTDAQRTTPVPVVSLSSGVTAIAGGAHFFLAVHNGFVYSWGWNPGGQLGYAAANTTAPAQVPGLSGIVDVSANFWSSFALAADGTLWSWGSNNNFNLGYAGGGSTPRQVTPPAGYKFTGVSAGHGFTMATIAPACPADFGRAAGATGPDGRLDNNDLVAFIDAFFAHDPLADVGSTGASPTPDGQFNNNDFIVFIERFFGGC
jgi:hypothetical protein